MYLHEISLLDLFQESYENSPHCNNPHDVNKHCRIIAYWGSFDLPRRSSSSSTLLTSVHAPLIIQISRILTNPYSPRVTHGLLGCLRKKSPPPCPLQYLAYYGTAELCPRDPCFICSYLRLRSHRTLLQPTWTPCAESGLYHPVPFILKSSLHRSILSKQGILGVATPLRQVRLPFLLPIVLTLYGKTLSCNG